MKCLVPVFVCLFACVSAGVLEFDDKFPAVSKQGKWLIMFYAPWCGHCKHMEPVWKEVSQRMSGSDVQVGRLDCTKYSSIASMYGVRGFPTIKFIREGKTFDYNGARTTNNLVTFVNRASGPIVEKLQSEQSLKEKIVENSVMFTYVGTEVDDLWKVYEEAAQSLFTELYFTTIHPNLIKSIKLKSSPAILVFKDNTFYVMDKQFDSYEMIRIWMYIERLPSFPELNGHTYSKLKSTGRKMAISIVEERNDKLNETVGSIALKREQPFSFCWTLGNSIVNSLTYATIPVPNLVVFDSTSQTYYLLSEHAKKIDQDEVVDEVYDESAIQQFLDDVKNGEMSPMGGMSIWQQIKRTAFDIAMALVNFFQDGPILASIVIVIPTFIITALCVCICTMTDDDVTGDEIYDEDEDSDDLPPSYQDQEQPGSEPLPIGEDDGVRKRQVTAVAENAE